MRFGWARASTLAVASALVVALGACGDAGDERAENAREAAFFMQSNARAASVQSLPSGLQYKVVASGPEGGRRPDANDLVRVDYEGALTNGTVFDSSFERGAPAVMSPDRLIPGWTEALQLMRPGDEWILYVPPELGYGERGAPPAIPPNAVLIFRLHLLDVAPTPGGGPVARG